MLLHVYMFYCRLITLITLITPTSIPGDFSEKPPGIYCRASKLIQLREKVTSELTSAKVVRPVRQNAEGKGYSGCLTGGLPKTNKSIAYMALWSLSSWACFYLPFGQLSIYNRTLAKDA